MNTESLLLLQEYTEFVSKDWHRSIYEKILAQVLDYIEQLKSDTYYGKSLLAYEDFPKSQNMDGLNLVLWDLGSGLVDWTMFDAFRTISEGSRLNIIWYRFDKVYKAQAEPVAQQKGKVKLIERQLDLFPSGFSTTDMEKLLKYTDSKWPDIIIAKHFFSRVEIPSDKIKSQVKLEEVMKDLINFYFHCLEPGGVFIIADTSSDSAHLETVIQQKVNAGEISAPLATYWRQGLALAKERKVKQSIYECLYEGNGGELSLEFDHNFLYVKKKDPNIFATKRIIKAPRADLFSEDVCKDFILQITEHLDFPKGAQLLDVGVGDGRFSRHLFNVALKKGWGYKGIEILPETKISNDVKELDRWVSFKTNFFCLEGREKYDAVFLIFMLHLHKHWKIMLHKAYELLSKGGYLVIGFRPDNFSYWRYGMFLDNFQSPIKISFQEYWRLREAAGIRNFDQMINNIAPFNAVNIAEELRFKVVDVVKAINVRQYELKKEHFCPGKKDPTYWSFSTLGLTSKDIEYLERNFKFYPASDLLFETVAAYIMKKI